MILVKIALIVVAPMVAGLTAPEHMNTPLPGLKEKAHLKGLTRDDLRLDLIHEYARIVYDESPEEEPVIINEHPAKTFK